MKLAEQAADFIDANFKQAGNAPGFLTAKPTGSAVAQPEPLPDENVALVRFFNMPIVAPDGIAKTVDSFAKMQ